VPPRLFLIFVTATDPITDGLAGLRPYFGQPVPVPMQVRAWPVARPLASRSTACRRGTRHRYVFQWRSTSIFLTIDVRGAIRR
jgi:hypothetical protein